MAQVPGARTVSANPPLPQDALAILPVPDRVLFPHVLLPVAVPHPAAQAALQDAVRREQPVGVLLQNRPEAEAPTPQDLHWVGCSAAVLRYVTTPDGGHHAVLRGMRRFRALEFLEGHPFLAARVQFVDDPVRGEAEIEGRAQALKQQALATLELLPQVPAETAAALQAMDDASQLADVVAGLLDLPAAEKQALLELFDLRARLDRLIDIVARRVEVLKVSHDIEQRTRASLGDVNRRHVLREQMRQIQQELGEGDEGAAEIDELKRAIDAAAMPAEADQAARKELKRLERMPDTAGEYAMLRTYLERLTELPWKTEPAPPVDLDAARKVLDEDHFGLDKVKRRILEYLAVQKLNPTGRGPILCFVGPPGVGKTSLGQSIARATGRRFVRVSLGGVHDEAEIRGHRRTYLGALPGMIVQQLHKAGTRHCVLMLDEIDKLGGGGFHGDPAAALLEVLDPAQNSSFRDTYIGLPIDLSPVLFVCTANVFDAIPGPLRDRMEVIHLPGYTTEEKLQIARRYLLPRQLEINGLDAGCCDIGDATLLAIVERYTREAGVRQLEREIGGVLRHVAMRVASADARHVSVGPDDLTAILGARRFESEVALLEDAPGVVTGLAWTPVGGEIMFVEAARMHGSGRLILTGQLGDVMRESAQAALTLVKSRLPEAIAYRETDIHLHVPAGATPKDGPSAGVAMFVALVSLLTGRPVRREVAMTGEISLRGLVLPIGGVKSKVLAALRAGVRTVLLPERNRHDLDDVPSEARAKLSFVFLHHVDDALDAALQPSPRHEPVREAPVPG
jgi:ATP-dependent Lon protease